MAEVEGWGFENFCTSAQTERNLNERIHLDLSLHRCTFRLRGDVRILHMIFLRFQKFTQTLSKLSQHPKGI